MPFCGGASTRRYHFAGASTRLDLTHSRFSQYIFVYSRLIPILGRRAGHAYSNILSEAVGDELLPWRDNFV